MGQFKRLNSYHLKYKELRYQRAVPRAQSPLWKWLGEISLENWRLSTVMRRMGTYRDRQFKEEKLGLLCLLDYWE